MGCCRSRSVRTVMVLWAAAFAAACGSSAETSGHGGATGKGGDAGSAGAPATCTDAVVNGSETDVDCGGSCPPCAEGKACKQAADCTSLACTAGLCAAASCTDAVKNGGETDVDCGGVCPPCADGKACSVAGDCASGACVSGSCAAASCTDAVKNGDETDVDCGGACPPCAVGQACSQAGDCASGVCVSGSCAAASCADAVKNGDETDVDCGGACPPCAVGQACGQGGDCTSGVCSGGSCAAASCTDGVKNGAETDVDCGGGCAPCAAGQACGQGGDCVSGVCSGGSCAAASCTDGVKNGAESDIDCGDGCAPCAPLLACNTPSDCASGWCAGGQCSPYLASCRAHKQANPAAATGVFPIDPDGAGPAAPFNVFCDQTTDGGGWTVAFNMDHADTVSTLVATDAAYLHQDAACPATGMNLGVTFSCVSKLHAAGFETIAAAAEIMFYVVHADAPTPADNPWLKTRLAGLKDLSAFLTHSRSAAAKCNDGTCNSMVAAMTNLANVGQNKWFAAASPLRFVTDASYMNGSIALSHMWHDSGGKRCNSDLDRLHYAVVNPAFADSFGSLPGVAYYRNGYTFDCFYSDVPAKKISSRVMLRE